MATEEKRTENVDLSPASSPTSRIIFEYGDEYGDVLSSVMSSDKK